jgi:hypothetical protein
MMNGGALGALRQSIETENMLRDPVNAICSVPRLETVIAIERLQITPPDHVRATFAAGTRRE